MHADIWVYSRYLGKRILVYGPDWQDHLRLQREAQDPVFREGMALQREAERKGLDTREYARQRAQDKVLAMSTKAFYAAIADAPYLTSTTAGDLYIPDLPAGVATKAVADRYEIKAQKLEDGIVALTGYASRWGGPPDSYNDVIERGAYAATIRSKAGKRVKLPLLAGHDAQKPIGGVLSLKEDDTGLLMQAVLDASIQAGREALSGIQKGYNSGLSIGYRTDDSWTDNKGVRHLTAISLFEISVTPLPAAGDRASVTRISYEG